jgi:hypothetical protein
MAAWDFTGRRTGTNAVSADVASGTLRSAADHRRTCYAVGW